MKQPSLTRNDLAHTHRTGRSSLQSSRLQSSRPHSNRLQSSRSRSNRLQSSRLLTHPSLRTRRSRRLLWPKRQAARSLCRGAAGQARTTAAGQFSCADMKLSAAQVFSREDEDESLTDHGPPPPAPPFARPPQSPPPPPPSLPPQPLPPTPPTNLLVLQAATAH